MAFAPDYMTPEGITALTFDLTSVFTEHVDRIRGHLDAAIECLKSLPYVDPSRISVLGFSLGGYFGLLLASRADVRGLVSYYGAYHGRPASLLPTRYPFSEIAALVKARVLMFHGDADSEVRFDIATRAHQMLVSSGKQVKLVTYPGVGHRFVAPGSPNYNAEAVADTNSRTLAFLRDVLR